MGTNKVMPPAMKAEFESAFRAMFGFGSDEIIATGNDSAAAMMGAAAWAWQASREAVAVQLPESYENHLGELVVDRDDLCDLLKAQGLKALAQAVADLEDIPERAEEHAEAKDALLPHMHCHTILALLAEIERLESAKGDPVGSFDKHMEYMQENIRLKAENEALRKDAERYRWLMSGAVYNGTLGIADGWIDFEFKDEAQKAIDAAMTKEMQE